MDIPGIRLSYKSFRGKEIEEAIAGLGKLRIAVFREYPYLYDGDLDHEKDYLNTYINSEGSFVFAVYDGSEMVGATTCIPLSDETADVQEPFLEKGMNIDSIFYFGESILLKDYRGLGIGNRFFAEREAHARSFPEKKEVCFCAVRRESDHKLKPEGYEPHDNFWARRGYHRSDNIVSYFEWKDIGDEVPTSKPMDYWFKQI